MKVLMIKTSSLGDIIHTFPVADFIKHNFPEAVIDWVVEHSFSSLLHSHPNINKVIEVNTKSWRNSPFSINTWREIASSRQMVQQQRYDIVFDLQGNIKSGMILSWVSADRKVGYGKETVPERPNTLFTKERFNPPKGNNIREDYLCVVREALCIHEPFTFSPLSLNISECERAKVDSLIDTSKKNILISPGSAWVNKRLSFNALDEFISLFHEKDSKSHFLLSWGSDEERNTCTALQRNHSKFSTVLPKLELSSLHYLMSRVSLVFAMDSLPLHLAGTTKTPTFGVFGPSNAQKYAPIGKHHLSFQGECPYGKTFDKRCPILRTCKTGACMKNITGKDLLKLILRASAGQAEV